MSWKVITLTLLGILFVFYGALEVILRRGFKIHFPPPSWLGDKSKPMDPRWVHFYYWTKQRFWWMRSGLDWIIGRRRGERFPPFIEKIYGNEAVYHGSVLLVLGVLLLLLLWLDGQGFF